VLWVRRLSTVTDREMGTGKRRSLKPGSRKPKSAVSWVVSLCDWLVFTKITRTDLLLLFPCAVVG